eukprot:4804840-Prorocentrum_lima.AAC.1
MWAKVFGPLGPWEFNRCGASSSPQAAHLHEWFKACAMPVRHRSLLSARMGRGERLSDSSWTA